MSKPGNRSRARTLERSRLNLRARPFNAMVNDGRAKPSSTHSDGTRAIEKGAIRESSVFVYYKDPE
jgi:hypothetical protein